MGRAIARRLVGEGCSVTLAGRRGDVLDDLALELGDAAAVAVADLSVEEDLSRLGGGDFDLFVSAASVGGGGDFHAQSVAGIDRVLQVNLRAPLVLARLLGERMLGRGAGHIVFVSSLAGKSVLPGGALDSAGRFGVRGLALGLRQDWAGRGVGVSCVNVGPVAAVPADPEAALPAGFRPRSAVDVAAAVVRAVRNDRAEVDVADPVKRAGVVLGQVAPQAAVKLSRLVNGGLG